jgi:hypothetical protein
VSHMVIYRGVDGKPGYHQTDDIHDAVGFVERMRNDEGVEQARIFRLEEVVFEYRPYYRVQISSQPSLNSAPGVSSIESGQPNAESSNPEVASGVSPELMEAVEGSNVVDDEPVKDRSNGMADLSDLEEFVESQQDPEPVPNKRGLFGR